LGGGLSSKRDRCTPGRAINPARSGREVRTMEQSAGLWLALIVLPIDMIGFGIVMPILTQPEMPTRG
jgi:hypothetical protein